jgi:hypothetical protein
VGGFADFAAAFRRLPQCKQAKRWRKFYFSPDKLLLLQRKLTLQQAKLVVPQSKLVLRHREVI